MSKSHAKNSTSNIQLLYNQIVSFTDVYALQLACQSKMYLYLMNTEIIPNRCDRYQKIK